MRIARCVIPGATAPGIVALLGTVAAAFYGTAVGTGGTGGAAVAPARTVTLAVTGTVSSALYPGGPGAAVSVSVTNPYDAPLTVTGVTAGTPVVTGCANADLSVATTPGGLPFTVPAGGTAVATLTGVVTMGTAAGAGCQGATVAVPLRVEGRA